MNVIDAIVKFLGSLKAAPPPPALPPVQADEGEGPGHWHPFEGPLKEIPKGRSGLYAVYGDPKPFYKGKELVCDRDWERANLATTRDLPGYAKPIYCHRLVEPYLREALRRARIACPDFVIDVIGCFCPRYQRHDSSRPLSDHTWAIAFDLRPNTNQGVYRTKANPVPQPFEPGWEKFSDLPRGVVEAFESVGFEWGGRWQSFVDPMHVQLRRT